MNIHEKLCYLVMFLFIILLMVSGYDLVHH